MKSRYLVIRFNRNDTTTEADQGYLHRWRQTSLRLLDIAHRVWEAVKDILCADAPEGYEVEGLDDQVVVDTKDLLSFCWRALKESRSTKLHCSLSKIADMLSTLMHSMIAGSKPTTISQAFQQIHYRRFGDLAFTELAELRHRGAFSTVSQTFAACCSQCARSEDPETKALPEEWYQV